MSDTFAAKEDAERWARETERALDRGRMLPDAEKQRHTVANAIDRWLDDRLPDRAESDRANVRQMLNWWKNEGKLGGIALLNLTPDDILKARSKLRGATKTPSGAKRTEPRKQAPDVRSDASKRALIERVSEQSLSNGATK